MAEWMKLAVVHTLVGLEASTLGLLSFFSGNDATKALLIIGFLLFVVSAVLLALHRLAPFAADMIIAVVSCILLFIAAVFIVAGVGVHDKANEPYSATLQISSALFAVLAGVFLVMQLVSGSGSKTGPS